MHIKIFAVGKMKGGPERDMLERYLDRARKAGRPLHLFGPEIREFQESKQTSSATRRDNETADLLSALPPAARLVALDERGKAYKSKEFAQFMQNSQNDTIQDLVFAIGGPDGHGSDLISRADHSFSMGSFTWPHQLARIMLCEQIYRAMTILSGHPYHRQ